METFSALLAFCVGNSTVPGEFPTRRPVTRNFDVFFDLRLSKPLSKQWWGWWFEMLSCPLWRHRNGCIYFHVTVAFAAVHIQSILYYDIYGLWQKRHNSSALAVELRLSCANLSIYCAQVETYQFQIFQISVKVQLGGLELFNEKVALFQEE